MTKDFLKTKNLDRLALKQIVGGDKVLPVNCFTLCGPGGGVISNRPGIGGCLQSGQNHLLYL